MKSPILAIGLLVAVLAGVLALVLGDDGNARAARLAGEEADEAEREQADLLIPTAARPEPSRDEALELEAGETGTRSSAPGGAPAVEVLKPQEPVTVAVYGSVLDAQGRPVPGIEVRMENANRVLSSLSLGTEEVQFFRSGIPSTGIPVSRSQIPSKGIEGTAVWPGHDHGPGSGPAGNSPRVTLSSRDLPIPPVQIVHDNGPGQGTLDKEAEAELQKLLAELERHQFQILSGRAPSAITDEKGEFDLGEVIPGENARLVYGASLFMGKPPTQDLIPDDRAQILRLSAPPISGLSITLVGPPHAPEPEPEWVTFDLMSLADDVPRGRREVSEWDIELSAGAIVARGLAPGSWSAWIRCRGAEPVQQTFTVENERGLTASRAEIPVPEESESVGSPLGELAFDATNTTVSRDTFSGFDDYTVKGQTHRGFGGNQSDAFFGHTISGFGNGRLRAAYLEIVLEGVSGMCSNDSLGLEYRGANATPRWAWHQAISSLPGIGAWRRGDRQRIILDLSRLPTKDGTISILSDLEDGFLDVFVQDDTTVHSIKLRPYR